MAAYTLAQAQAQLDATLAAMTKVLEKGQAITIDGDGVSRTFTRADIGKLQELVEFWTARVNALEAAGSASGRGRIRTSYFVPE